MKLYFYILLLILASCVGNPKDAVMGDKPPIYPDYQNVTVPVNIAPLNFLLRLDCQAVWVEAKGQGQQLVYKVRGNEVRFPIKDWKQLLAANIDNTINVRVAAKIDNHWIEYQPFNIYVSSDSLDSYLTYRLIEPDYEIFSRLQICERCVENFDERSLCDYKQVGNRCMNCHTFNQNDPNTSFMYVRGEGGGLVLNRNGKLRLLNLKTPDMVSGSVYAQFSPNGRWLAFSSNVIIPGFHANPHKRLEVFDSKSDIYVADLETNEIIRNPLLVDSTRLTTFPAFSPDGKSIFFCMTNRPEYQNLDSLQYSLCRIGFDESSGNFDQKIDTIILARWGDKRSISHPRISPDGKRVLYTVADYGTFPIWHTEADLQMMDLTTGDFNTLDIVNSAKSDTYHSWSSSGRWFVFASKRDDGLYGKPYFCHVDADGSVSKPFVLPQKHPTFYDNNLKSFNVPELGTAPLPFSASSIPPLLQSSPESFY